MPIEFSIAEKPGEKVSATTTIYVENKATVPALIAFLFKDKNHHYLEGSLPKGIAFSCPARVIAGGVNEGFDIQMTMDFATYSPDPLSPPAYIVQVQLQQEETVICAGEPRKSWVYKTSEVRPITITATAPVVTDLMGLWADKDKTTPL